LLESHQISFSDAELARYQRHFVLPGFGAPSQQKLKAARVLVVGAGGLGSPMLLYLAAAGVGVIGIVEFDVVDTSNLQRQVLYTEQDVGRLKVEAARDRLLALNPYIKINLHTERLTADNALQILEQYDVVADGADNFPTRYLVNDAAVLLQKPCVHAAIFQFEGQVSVFNYTDPQGITGPNYRDLFPTPPAPEAVPNCAEGGVLGVLPGIIGSVQANEVIKIITGTGNPLSGRLFIFDALLTESRVFNIKRRSDNPLNGEHPTITQLIDYEYFCGLIPEKTVKEITAETLLQWQASGELAQLIDVREPSEYQGKNMGALLLPLATVTTQAHRIQRTGKVVIHCHSGLRSATAIQQLEAAFGFDNLYNLKGGILAYTRAGGSV
jgi:sulfur-carrier protein adenylyltransferase/sulfurtransferase